MRIPTPLSVSTPSDREVSLTRNFNAPRRLVYEAYTKPELVKRWGAGPPGWEMTTCEIDLRVGGAWRWELVGPGGQKMGLGGIYQEIIPFERLVSSEKFDESWYEGEAVSSITLVESNGVTTLTMTILYASKEVRDAVLKTPMAEGVGAGLEKLADILVSLAA